MYSALHAGGRRLHELARAGIAVERSPRRVRVHAFELIEYASPRLRVRVACGSGTYVRSLAADVGEALRCGGHVEALARTRVGPLRLEDAVPWAVIQEGAPRCWPPASFRPIAPSRTSRPSTCQRTPAGGWPTASAFPCPSSRPLTPRRGRFRAACTPARPFSGSASCRSRDSARFASSMQIVRGLDQYRPDAPPSVVAQGTFDGIHLGHQAVIRTAVGRARALGVRPVAVTFEPNPLAVLRPAEAPPELLPLDERLERIAALGPDACLVIPFTAEFSQVEAEAYVRDVLLGLLGREGDRRRLQPRVRTGSSRDPRAPPAPGGAGRGPRPRRGASPRRRCRRLVDGDPRSPSRGTRPARGEPSGAPLYARGRRDPGRGPRARRSGFRRPT